jgi:hypothetical protein
MPGRQGGLGGEEPIELRELALEMLIYLRGVVRSEPGGRQLSTGVAAAGRVLAHCEWYEERRLKPRETLLHVLNGDEAALEAWLRAELAAVEARKHTGT